MELRSLIFDTHLDRWRYLFIFNFRTPDSPTRKWTHRHENVSGKFKRRKMMNLALCLEHVVFIWRGERKRRNRRYRFRKMVNNSRNFLLASIITMFRYVNSVWYVYFMSNLCHAVYLLYRKSFMSLTVWNKTQLFSYPPFLTVYRQNEENGENVSPSNISWKPPKVVDKAVFTPEPLRRNDTLRRSLQRRVSMKVLRKKMKKFQDYSLPYDANFKYLNHLTLSYKSQFCRACKGSKVGFSIYFIITGKTLIDQHR